MSTFKHHHSNHQELKKREGVVRWRHTPKNFPASSFWFAWTDNDDKAGQLIAVSRSWFCTSVPRRWVFSPFLLTDAVRHKQTTADRGGRGAYCCDSHTFLPKCSAPLRSPPKRANFLLVERLGTRTVEQNDTRKLGITLRLGGGTKNSDFIWWNLYGNESFIQTKRGCWGERRGRTCSVSSFSFLFFATALAGPVCMGRSCFWF